MAIDNQIVVHVNQIKFLEYTYAIPYIEKRDRQVQKLSILMG